MNIYKILIVLGLLLIIFIITYIGFLLLDNSPSTVQIIEVTTQPPELTFY